MKNTADIEELTNDSEAARFKTDKELMEEIGSDTGSSDSGTESESNFENDGVEFTSFSIKKELKEGHFDKYGSYVPDGSSSGEEDALSLSDEEEERFDEDAAKKSVANGIRMLIELLPPDSSVTDAIQSAAADEDRMSRLTKYSTELMLFGIHNVYDLTVRDLKEKLKQYSSDSPQL